MLSKTYGQPESSYIPLDYYFNSYGEDSQWNKQKLFFWKII